MRVATSLCLFAGSLALGAGGERAYPSHQTARETALNPRRAHLVLSVVSESGRHGGPMIRFFRTRTLSGAPAIQLGEDGLRIGARIVCTWPRGASRELLQGRLPLVSAEPSGGPCPREVFLRQRADGLLAIELAEINGSIAEVVYRGTRYFFSVKTLPGTVSHYLDPPSASPRMTGGVDVPVAFRPPKTGRFRITLRQSPAPGSLPVATLRSTRYLEVFSIGGGTLLATVYARQNGWHLLRLVDGRTGWLAPEDAGKFMSLKRLLQGNTYLSTEWDRKLAAAPGDAMRFDVPRDPRRSWIGHLERRAKSSITVDVYGVPDLGTSPVARFDDEGASALESISTSEGAYLPIVFSRQPGWLEVGLRNSSKSYRAEGIVHVWIPDTPGLWLVREVHPDDADRVLSLSWPADTTAAELLETRTIGGRLWLRVRVFMGEACERSFGDVPERVLGEGWVPAHASNGHPVMWFETYCD